MSYKGFVIRYRTEDGSEHMIISDDISLASKVSAIMNRPKIFSVRIEPHKTKIEAIQALSQ